MELKERIADLLRRTAKPGAVTEETLSNIVTSLAQRISQWESVRRHGGDITVKVYERSLHESNLKEVDDTFNHALALRESRYINEGMRAELNQLLWEMDGLKKYMQATKSRSQGKLPKVTRGALCVEIIVAWKLIKNTEEIPIRDPSKVLNPEGEFNNFIATLLETADVSVTANTVDELHRNIGEINKELARLKEQAGNAEIIELSDYPTGLWGK